MANLLGWSSWTQAAKFLEIKRDINMGHLTDDPKDPRLTHGPDSEPVEQAEVYLVLSEKERNKGFVRPVRRKYVHVGVSGIQTNPTEAGCGALTTMGQELAETYARDPKFYGSTYCVGCRMHRPVEEFTWGHSSELVG